MCCSRNSYIPQRKEPVLLGKIKKKCLWIIMFNSWWSRQVRVGLNVAFRGPTEKVLLIFTFSVSKKSKVQLCLERNQLQLPGSTAAEIIQSENSWIQGSLTGFLMSFWPYPTAFYRMEELQPPPVYDHLYVTPESILFTEEGSGIQSKALEKDSKWGLNLRC